MSMTDTTVGVGSWVKRRRWWRWLADGREEVVLLSKQMARYEPGPPAGSRLALWFSISNIISNDNVLDKNYYRNHEIKHLWPHPDDGNA